MRGTEEASVVDAVSGLPENTYHDAGGSSRLQKDMLDNAGGFAGLGGKTPDNVEWFSAQ